MSIFALLYPFFVIQALVSRPPGLSASSITSPGSSLPPTPTEPSSGGGGNNPFFTERDGTNGWRGRIGAGVPMFVLARYGLEVLGWFEGAVGRKLGGGARKERAGKRLG
jgi:etoposide-induced 2.4 mRNA